MVEQVVKTHSLQQQEDTDSTRNVRGEVQTKTTFQRSAKGNITIAECDPNGKFITLENTHKSKVIPVYQNQMYVKVIQDEDISGCKIKRRLDSKKEITYTLPHNVVVRAGRTIKVILQYTCENAKNLLHSHVFLCDYCRAFQQFI